MTIPRKIRNFNLFLDGRSYYGLATEAKLPEVKIQTEAHRGGGQDGGFGIDVGLEGMTASATVAEWRPELLKSIGTVRRMVLRPAENADDARLIIATIEGLVTEATPGDLKPGTDAPLSLKIDVRAYRLEIDGEVILDIDLPGGRRVIGGVDQLAAHRRAMGL